MKRQIFDKYSTKQKRKTLRNNQTVPERLLWSKIRNRQLSGVKFRKQYGIGEYIADFYSVEAKLIIEIDGDSHFTEAAKEYDEIRTKYMESLELRVIRFTNSEVMENLENVLIRIEKIVQNLPSP